MGSETYFHTICILWSNLCDTVNCPPFSSSYLGRLWDHFLLWNFIQKGPIYLLHELLPSIAKCKFGDDKELNFCSPCLRWINYCVNDFWNRFIKTFLCSRACWCLITRVKKDILFPFYTLNYLIIFQIQEKMMMFTTQTFGWLSW